MLSNLQEGKVINAIVILPDSSTYDSLEGSVVKYSEQKEDVSEIPDKACLFFNLWLPRDLRALANMIEQNEKE